MTKPMTKITAIAPTAMLSLPVVWLTTATINVPRNDAPLPQMSNRPKYSPLFSAGMIFAK